MKTALTPAQIAQFKYIASGFAKALKPARRASDATWDALIRADVIKPIRGPWGVAYEITATGRALQETL